MMQQIFRSFIVGLMAANAWVSAISTQNHAGAGIHGRTSLPVARRTGLPFTHPAIARVQAYLKYNARLPGDLQHFMKNHFGKRAPRRIKGRQDSIVSGKNGSTTNQPLPYDTEWISYITIGTPPQKLPIQVDTGSSDLWVMSNETPARETGGNTIYYINRSTTAQLLGDATFDITYGDESYAAGGVYTDIVCFGELCYSAQAVESATVVSAEFTNFSPYMSGVLGLAFSSINEAAPQQQTFFSNVVADLEEPVFTADLKHDATGSYNFGFIDSSAYTGTIHYADVDSGSGFWMFNTAGYAVGNSTFTVDNLNVIGDTGTTLIYLPDSYLQAYYGQVPPATNSTDDGGFIFPCGTILPSFTFGVGGGNITIPGAYMNYAPIDLLGETCYGGMQSSNGLGLSILGGVALKSAFVVFNAGVNAGVNKIGWATKHLW